MVDFPREAPENNPNHQVHDELAQLRNMLLGPEQDKLNALQQRFDDQKQFTKDVSRVLPESILLKRAKDNQLTKALMPTG
jgi:hypothetical protein